MFMLTGEGFALAVAEIGEELRDFVFAGNGVLLGGRGAAV